MWLGKAQIGPMLEISLVHPHTIVSMLANDLADLDKEGPISSRGACFHPPRADGTVRDV
jgi:hypothetical protein